MGPEVGDLGFRFPSYVGLLNHQKNMICAICADDFPSFTRKRGHRLRSMHHACRLAESPWYQCPWCPWCKNLFILFTNHYTPCFFSTNMRQPRKFALKKLVSWGLVASTYPLKNVVGAYNSRKNPPFFRVRICWHHLAARWKQRLVARPGVPA